MTKTMFYKLYNGVNSISFDPACINESKIAYELRLKEVYVDFIEGEYGARDHIIVNWRSMGWYECNDEMEDFKAEIMRCMKHIGFIGVVTVDLCDHDRDNEVIFDFEVV